MGILCVDTRRLFSEKLTSNRSEVVEIDELQFPFTNNALAKTYIPG